MASARTTRSRKPPRKLFIVDWNALQARFRVERCAHHWVTDASIATALADPDHFDDPAVPWKQNTHRANRIASIVEMMGDGVKFDPLVINIDSGCVSILDGHHRLRAYQFRGDTGAVPVLVRADRAAQRLIGQTFESL